MSNKSLVPELFCGLHYTSDQDIMNKSDVFESFKDRQFILFNYVNYFLNLSCSMFKVHNLPENIDESFVIRNLIKRGSIAFFKAPESESINDISSIPLNAQPFRTNKRFNMYGKPTSIILLSDVNCDSVYKDKQLNDDKLYEIVRLNPQALGLYPTIFYFCNKIVETQRAIDVNVFNNQTPIVVEGTPNQVATINEFELKWSEQRRFIVLDKTTGTRREDLFNAQDISATWKADKMTDVMQYYKAEFFTMLGINHTPYEKRANMVRDEVRSNSHILRLTVDSMLDELNTCAKLVNKKFGTDIYFEYTLDSIYDNDIISTAESKETAGIISHEESIDEQLEEAEIKEALKVND